MSGSSRSISSIAWRRFETNIFWFFSLSRLRGNAVNGGAGTVMLPLVAGLDSSTVMRSSKSLQERDEHKHKTA